MNLNSSLVVYGAKALNDYIPAVAQGALAFGEGIQSFLTNFDESTSCDAFWDGVKKVSVNCLPSTEDQPFELCQQQSSLLARIKNCGFQLFGIIANKPQAITIFSLNKITEGIEIATDMNLNLRMESTLQGLLFSGKIPPYSLEASCSFKNNECEMKASLELLPGLEIPLSSKKTKFELDTSRQGCNKVIMTEATEATEARAAETTDIVKTKIISSIENCVNPTSMGEEASIKIDTPFVELSCQGANTWEGSKDSCAFNGVKAALEQSTLGSLKATFENADGEHKYTYTPKQKQNLLPAQEGAFEGYSV